LIPGKERIEELRDDYRDMAQMIFGDLPPFGEVMDGVRALEDRINRLQPINLGETTPRTR